MKKIVSGIFGGLIALSMTLPAMAANIIYTSQKAGYTMTFPGTWTLTPTQGMVDVLMVSPAESANDNYKENISVVVEPTALNTSASYYADNKLAMSKTLKNFTIVKEGMDIVAKKVAYWMTYTQDTDNGGKLQLQSYFFYKDGKGYVVTCAATPTSFVPYSTVFKQVVNTMKF